MALVVACILALAVTCACIWRFEISQLQVMGACKDKLCPFAQRVSACLGYPAMLPSALICALPSESRANFIRESIDLAWKWSACKQQLPHQKCRMRPCLRALPQRGQGEGCGEGKVRDVGQGGESSARVRTVRVARGLENKHKKRH